MCLNFKMLHERGREKMQKLQKVLQEEKRPLLILYFYTLFLYSPLIVLRLTNSMDGMWDQDDHVAGVAELRIGRWFWPYLDKLRLNISLDPLPVIVSLVFFVAGFLLIVSILQLRMSWITYGAAALFLSSPAVLCQLSYSYMSITFAVSFLLAVVAVWLIARNIQKRFRRREVLGQTLMAAFAIALMMGCYQASLGVTCVTAMTFFLLLLAREEKGSRKPWQFVLRMLSVLALGALLYEFLLQMNLRYFHETMSDYNGADAITLSGVLSNLPEAIRHTYSSFCFYYGLGGYHFNALQSSRWFYLLYLIPVACCIGLIIQGARRAGLLRGVMVVCGILLLPVFANSFFLLAAGAEMMMQMTAGTALTLPLVLCFWPELLPQSSRFHGRRDLQNSEKVALDSMDDEARTQLRTSVQGTERMRQAVSALAAAAMALLCYGAAGQAAIDQYAMYVGRRGTMTLASQIMDEWTIAGTDYTGQVVLVYGAPADSPLFAKTDLYEKANPYAQYGDWSGGTELNRLFWFHFFEQQLRVNVNYAEGDTLETIYNSPEVAAMPVYPAAGSTANVWGVTVVKVSE